MGFLTVILHLSDFNFRGILPGDFPHSYNLLLLYGDNELLKFPRMYQTFFYLMFFAYGLTFECNILKWPPFSKNHQCHEPIAFTCLQKFFQNSAYIEYTVRNLSSSQDEGRFSSYVISYMISCFCPCCNTYQYIWLYVKFTCPDSPPQCRPLEGKDGWSLILGYILSTVMVTHTLQILRTYSLIVLTLAIGK